MKNKIKEGLEKLASDLYNLGEIEMTKDVYRVISKLPAEKEKSDNAVKKISSVQEIEKAKIDFSKIFSR